MSTYSAMKEALAFYSKRDNMTKAQCEQAIIHLSEWGIFSNRGIAQILGVQHGVVDGISRKPSRTGGRFVPEALAPAMTLLDQRMRGLVDPDLVKSTVEMGVSTSYLAKLTGIPQRTVARMAGKS